MESIGAKLQGARSARGLSLEQAARDTHITLRYLEALENEDFEAFPGEPYLLGFLRNYSTYLGLNPEEFVGLYRNIQIQEQPAPIDELLDRKPLMERLRPFLIGVAAAVLVGAVVLLFATGIVSLPEIQRRSADDLDENPPMVLDRAFVEDRFQVGDRVAIPVDGVNAIIEFVSVGEQVVIGSNAGRVQLANGQERVLDITGEGSGDVRIVVRNLYPDDNPPAVVARVDRVISPPSPEPEDRTAVESDAQGEPITQTAEPAREREAQLLTTVTALERYFLELDIRGLTMVRWEVDDEPRQERYLQSGEQVRASVTDGARLWISNAGNVRMRAAGFPVDLGAAGEVVAARLRWRPVDEGFALELLPLY